jgi:GT2 family glycosyltransferase
MKLSVVVPTRDTRALTLRCLETVSAAAVDGLEVIVVDDGSRDGTAAAIRARFPFVRLLEQATPGGFAVAANHGLDAARGDVLLVLNSDTEVAPDALWNLRSVFGADPALGAAGATLSGADGRPQWSGGSMPDVAWLVGLSSGAAAMLSAARRWMRPPSDAVDWVSGAALAIRREAWRAVGPFDTGFRFYCQDLDLCLRLRDAGWRIAVLPEVHVVHRRGATIARHRAATSGYVPELLWTDLVRWAGKRAGAAGGRRAQRMLLLGGVVRVGARSLLRPLLLGERRAAWARDTRTFERALGALWRLQATPE